MAEFKLYTDFNLFQREFCKSIRSSCNKNIFDKLYYGVNSIMCFDQYKRRNLHVAGSFGDNEKNGIILVIKPEKISTKYKSWQISWIPDYQQILIESWILSSSGICALCLLYSIQI